MRKLRPYHLAIAATAVATAGYAILQYQSRRLNEEAERLWQLLGLRSGARIAEIGAGSGEIIRRIASRIGASGQVFATEADASRVAKLTKKVPARAFRNLAILKSMPEHCGLAPNSCDAIYMRSVYHHFTRPRETNKSILSALRAGGTLAVIDFPPRWWLAPWTPEGIPADRGGHGIRPQLAAEELVQAGFAPVRTVQPWGMGTYCLVFQKQFPEE